MLNVAQLLLPISVEQACGVDLCFSSEMDEVAQARMCDDPTLDQGEWLAPLKEANWELVASRCAALIESSSKDMRLAVWLAESQAKIRGLRGLGDGYAVLAGLCDCYWDGLYPLGDDEGYEQRIGNLFWLLTRTLSLFREVATSASAVALADAEYCMAMLVDLERAVDQRLGDDGPSFSAAKDALRAAIHAMAPNGGIAAPTIDGVLAGAPQAGVIGACAQTRGQALLQLRQVADFFRRTEPHSPVAYLADKAANWGDLPLHLWLRAVIKDPAVIAGVEELLGSRVADE